MTEGPRILNLEDDPVDAELIRHELIRDGLNPVIRRVDTQEEFREAMGTFSPHLILSDYSLPSFNGLAALKIVREVAPEIPFIFISGTLGEEKAIETMRLGATDYVLKHQLTRLGPVVRRALEESGERIMRKRAEDERNKLWAAVESGGDWIMITNRDGKIEYANSTVEQLSGYRRSEILGRNPAMFRSDKQDESFYREMWERLLSGSPFRSIIVNRSKSGSYYYLDLTITPLSDDQGQICTFVATGKDISEKRLLEERLNFLAYNDALTGLANRTLFFDRLQQAITIMGTGEKLIVTAIIDIKRFKYVNETFGVAAGDEILKEVARRLAGAVRPKDTVARYGGNSFGLILTDIREMKDAILIIEKVMNQISIPYRWGEQELINTFGMGIAVCPTDSTDSGDLLKFAEAALVKAKEIKGVSYRFYKPGMNIIADNFLAIEKDLFHALAADEFVLHYQPYFEIRTGELKGMEALIRWERSGGNLVLPGEFTPILEETGLIVDVGEWVIRTACSQIRQWRARGYPLVPVSVNLSPSQFSQENLVSRIVSHMEAAQVPAELLTIEITENIFVSNVPYTRQVLDRFRQLGLRLSIDDFGTGYSSLSYLARLPLNNLKIDISFIRDLATDPKAYCIVKVIIAMAHELGLKTIAEGVETAEQLAILGRLGCDLVQGYYYYGGMTGNAMEKILQVQRIDVAHKPVI